MKLVAWLGYMFSKDPVIGAMAIGAVIVAVNSYAIYLVACKSAG